MRVKMRPLYGHLAPSLMFVCDGLSWTRHKPFKELMRMKMRPLYDHLAACGVDVDILCTKYYCRVGPEWTKYYCRVGRLSGTRVDHDILCTKYYCGTVEWDGRVGRSSATVEWDG